MKNLQTKLILSVFIINFSIIFYNIFAPTRVERIVPTFQNSEIVMVAPAESCGGIIISQPSTAIENWDYNNDTLELKSWRHFVGDNNEEQRVPLSAPLDWKFEAPQVTDKNPEKLKSLKLMYDSSGTTISDFYSISCAKKTVVNGKIQEPQPLDCRGVLTLSGYQESDKYLKCNSKTGPLTGYNFAPLNLNVVQPLETAPQTRGITDILKPEF